ncbi:unnamed protein product [Chrysoparadoxa australica]
MEGFNEVQREDPHMNERGIIPRSIEQIFGHIQKHASPTRRFLVRASYLQIYNEQISDLLKPERTNLTIREDKKRGVFVEGLSEWVVRSPEEIYGLMERGGQLRATGATRLNEISSRSHAVFIIIVEQSETYYVNDEGDEVTPEAFAHFMHMKGFKRHSQEAMNHLETHLRQSFKVGKLNLVDLAGSERVRLSGATGQRLEESKKINQSLSALGNVIAALTDAKGRQHIPYRDSKLTRILEDSLGGNCKTTMMAMISPALESMLETLSTVKFANRAKNIKNAPVVNEDLDQKSLLRKYERELKRLRAELEERSRNVVDKRQLLQLEEERRRAEADKMAAIRALEARSQEFLQEKEEKRRLEERIQSLTSQMIRGVNGEVVMEDDAAMDNAAHILMKQEYEGRLAALEQERETIEEEKAQVDRYKQLLLKQRDIMIALTQRLNERDELVFVLEEELSSYDKRQRDLEEKLDDKTAQLIHLQRAILEHNATGEHSNEQLVEAIDWESARQQEQQRESLTGGSGISNKADGLSTQPLSQVESPTASIANSKSIQAGVLQAIGQLRPHGSSRPGQSMAAASTSTPAAPGEAPLQILTPNEKIAELEGIIESRDAELRRVQEVLHEVHADKANMEGLLREKLEKLVVTEIEDRLTSQGHALGGSQTKILQAKVLEQESALSELRQQFADTQASSSGQMEATSQKHREAAEEAELLSSLVRQLQLDNERLRAELQADPRQRGLTGVQTPHESGRESTSTSRQSQSGSSDGEMSRIKARLDSLVEERRAVQTIMEQKISVLVDSVARSASMALEDSDSAHAQEFNQDLQHLQRLVSASVVALQNAAVEDHG